MKKVYTVVCYGLTYILFLCLSVNLFSELVLRFATEFYKAHLWLDLILLVVCGILSAVLVVKYYTPPTKLK